MYYRRFQREISVKSLYNTLQEIPERKHQYRVYTMHCGRFQRENNSIEFIQNTAGDSREKTSVQSLYNALLEIPERKHQIEFIQGTAGDSREKTSVQSLYNTLQEIPEKNISIEFIQCTAGDSREETSVQSLYNALLDIPERKHQYRAYTMHCWRFQRENISIDFMQFTESLS